MNLLRIPSLRWRLVVVMCVAYVIVAAVSGAVGYSAQRDNLHRQLVARARNDAAILAAGAVSPLNIGTTGSRQTLRIFVTAVRSARGAFTAPLLNANCRKRQSGSPGTLSVTDLRTVREATYRVLRSTPPKVQFDELPVGTVPTYFPSDEYTSTPPEVLA